jgi:hypothetical protein
LDLQGQTNQFTLLKNKAFRTLTSSTFKLFQTMAKKVSSRLASRESSSPGSILVLLTLKRPRMSPSS